MPFGLIEYVTNCKLAQSSYLDIQAVNKSCPKEQPRA